MSSTDMDFMTIFCVSCILGEASFLQLSNDTNMYPDWMIHFRRVSCSMKMCQFRAEKMAQIVWFRFQRRWSEEKNMQRNGSWLGEYLKAPTVDFGRRLHANWIEKVSENQTLATAKVSKAKKLKTTSFIATCCSPDIDLTLHPVLIPCTGRRKLRRWGVGGLANRLCVFAWKDLF